MKAIDIETIPNRDLIPALPEPEIAMGNLKDPAKIKEKIDSAKKEQIEKMGLNPFTGRICSYAASGDDGNHFKTIPAISEAEEILLINHIFKELEDAFLNREIIITWNGFSFDFPYIFKRAALLRVEKPKELPGLRHWTRKYSTEVHIDLMREMNGWEQHGNLNLDYAGKCFLGRGKTNRDYQTYVELIESGKSEIIGADNLCDTELTLDIYKTVSPYLF